MAGKEPQGARRGGGWKEAAVGPRAAPEETVGSLESPPLWGRIFKFHMHHGKMENRP